MPSVGKDLGKVHQFKPPRAVEVIQREIDQIEFSLSHTESESARAEQARDLINERIAAMQAAFLDGNDYGNVRQRNIPDAIRRELVVRAAIDAGKIPHGDDENSICAALSRLVPARPGAPTMQTTFGGPTISYDDTVEAWNRCLAAPAKVDELARQQVVLFEEMALAEDGPGERMPYVIVAGGILGRTEDNGKFVTYDVGKTVMLNRYEALARLPGTILPATETEEIARILKARFERSLPAQRDQYGNVVGLAVQA